VNIIGLTVNVACSDGFIREVALDGKQPKQIIGYITHIQGGKIRVRTKPLGKISVVKEEVDHGHL
jgi:hypothetical protein